MCDIILRKHGIQLTRTCSLYTAATYIGGLDDDQVSGSTPTFGTLLCLCEESIGGKGSDEKVRFGLVSAQPSTGEVVYDGECCPE